MKKRDVVGKDYIYKKFSDARKQSLKKGTF